MGISNELLIISMGASLGAVNHAEGFLRRRKRLLETLTVIYCVHKVNRMEYIYKIDVMSTTNNYSSKIDYIQYNQFYKFTVIHRATQL